jgi:hypothetical protein
MGEAVAHVTRRHSHPRAVEDPTPPVEPSGIDYLGLVDARHHETLEQRIAYVELPEGERPEDIVTTWPSAWDLATDRPIEEEGQ